MGVADLSLLSGLRSLYLYSMFGVIVGEDGNTL